VLVALAAMAKATVMPTLSPLTVPSMDSDECSFVSTLLAPAPNPGALLRAFEGPRRSIRTRLATYGARLALDGWTERAWTEDILARMSGMPSSAWRSVLLAADAGVADSAWALAYALDDEGRAALLAMDQPALVTIAAAGLDAMHPRLPEVTPAIAALVGAIVRVRQLLGDVPPPWGPDFLDHAPLSAAARSAIESLREMVIAAGLQVPAQPEVATLAADVGDGDADLVVNALNQVAADLAASMAPQLRGCLDPDLRQQWRAEWTAFAVALKAVADGDSVDLSG